MDDAQSHQVASPSSKQVLSPRRNCPSGKTTRAKKTRDRPSDPQCKTCSYCRLKKIKCDSVRPSCRACVASDTDCIYPRDTRRLMRPSQVRIDHLEQKLAAVWEHIASKSDGSQSLPFASYPADAGPGTPATSARLQEAYHAQETVGAADSHASPALRGSPASIAAQSPPFAGYSVGAATPGASGDAPPPRTDTFRSPPGDMTVAGFSSHVAIPTPRSAAREPVESEKNNDKGGTPQTDLSPREAQIAGLDVGQDGHISVHGPSSMMHQERTGRNIDEFLTDGSSNYHAAKARLVSYAVVQRQTEAMNYRTPPRSMDLDGVEPELAKHLLDLHWNRQHFAYLLTYRPAVMDSLAHGGRWCNKLLLNAMYYTSCLYSDRECLRTSPGDTQTAGDRFYTRFRELLVDEIVRPSIPSAAALLLIGPALVSQGRTSAGWNLCGVGYRMVSDMGCHLAMGSTNGSSPGTGRDISLDIEREWRIRLYWGALVTDATQSLYLGRQMTLRPAEGRVSQLFLDTYEELEEWKPYIDELHPPALYSVLSGYQSKPAFAVSTFTGLIKLAQITARITQSFYGFDCIKKSTESLLETKHDIETELRNYKHDLPTHLCFEPGIDAVPPPHQITPHTTYHVLNILLQRPFLNGGHLQDHTNGEDQASFEQSCVNSALAIQKLVSDYRDTFTLRRAPFLLSYSVYSAVVVILRQCKLDYSKSFRESMAFFLTALSELQRGCNFGLRKPVSIIRKMLEELGEHGLHPHDNTNHNDPHNESTATSQMMQMYAFQPMPTLDGMEMQQPDFSTGHGDLLFGQTPEGFFDFLDHQERTIADDTLYGLFAQQASAF